MVINDSLSEAVNKNIKGKNLTLPIEKIVQKQMVVLPLILSAENNISWCQNSKASL